MKLIEIGEKGKLANEISLDDHLNVIVVEATVDHYRRIGFVTPWISYVAIKEGIPVGACGFKSSPVGLRSPTAHSPVTRDEGLLPQCQENSCKSAVKGMQA